MSWTEERIATVTKLWQDGHSASAIAVELGGVTRNAVIGKVHRLGLTGRGPATTVIKRRPRLSPQRMQRRRQERLAENPASELHALDDLPRMLARPRSDLPVPVAKRLSLTDLTEGTCKWPIGEPRDPDFHFCGHDPVEGAPYCEYHCSVGYAGRPVPKPSTWRPSGRLHLFRGAWQ